MTISSDLCLLLLPVLKIQIHVLYSFNEHFHSNCNADNIICNKKCNKLEKSVSGLSFVKLLGCVRLHWDEDLTLHYSCLCAEVIIQWLTWPCRSVLSSIRAQVSVWTLSVRQHTNTYLHMYVVFIMWRAHTHTHASTYLHMYVVFIMWRTHTHTHTHTPTNTYLHVYVVFIMWRTHTHKLYLQIAWEMNCTAHIDEKSVLRSALSPASHLSEQTLAEMPWKTQAMINKCPDINTQWWKNNVMIIYTSEN